MSVPLHVLTKGAGLSPNVLACRAAPTLYWLAQLMTWCPSTLAPGMSNKACSMPQHSTLLLGEYNIGSVSSWLRFLCNRCCSVVHSLAEGHCFCDAAVLRAFQGPSKTSARLRVCERLPSHRAYCV